MHEKVKIAFDPKGKLIPLEHVLPRKKLSAGIKKSARYKRMAASIADMGIIQPLAVYPQSGKNGPFVVLDGESRLAIAKEVGFREVPCIIATEYETFTYNDRVNRVPAIQEHFMVIKALKNGVSEERIAKALNVNVHAIRDRANLLVGICKEAVELLKVTNVPRTALNELKKVQSIRQIEIAELMVASNNFESPYAKALVLATPEQFLIKPNEVRKKAGVSPEDMARMEQEMAMLNKNFKHVEETHGDNVYKLTATQAYLRRLLNSAALVKYLSRNYRDILEQFQKIAETASLESCRDSALL